MKRLEDSIKTLNGVGDKISKAYSRLSIESLWDLLFYYPRDYYEYPESIDDCRDVLDGEVVALKVTIHERAKTNKARKMDITTVNAFCGETPLRITWFRSGYLSNVLEPHETYIFLGELKGDSAYRKKMEQPTVYTLEKYKSIRETLQPIYPLTRGIKNNQIIRNLNDLLTLVELEEYMPKSILEKRKLESFPYSIRQIHFPDTFDSLSKARNRLAYDEFLMFFLQLEQSKSSENVDKNTFVLEKRDAFNKCMDELPFDLTNGQKSCIDEILNDFESEFITQRLIQGDVGSGKTIIAFLLMTIMVENDYQAALMAPTEILARQHYETFCDYVLKFDLPFEVVVLTGSCTEKQKKEIYEKLNQEIPCYIIGTSALIQEKVNYHSLGLVITDEQHRFGVKQRDELRQKGITPFNLVMSATPIPRTLSLILYGDMNVSTISDVPSNRLPIKNAVIKVNERQKAYQFIYKRVQEGHQAYVICPLVESSNKTEAENVTDYGDKLAKYYQGSVSVGILHGKMKASEKQKVMEDFLEKIIDVLVSTTVVEVGVNVPNATVMLIENANRFGLAQLHQLRGRVGRGADQSYCIFVDAGKDNTPNKRLEVISHSNDGFYVANEDLKLRGPGDFYGIRQSGDFDFGLADIYQDANLLKYASEDAKNIILKDPELKSDEYRMLGEFIQQLNDHRYTNL